MSQEEEEAPFKTKHTDLPFTFDDAPSVLGKGVTKFCVAIEYLLDRMKANDKLVDKIDKDVRSRTYLIDKMTRERTEDQRKIKEIENQIKALEQKTVELQDTMFQNNTDIESFKMNIQMNMRGVSGLLERVNDLEDHDEDHEKRLKELEDGMKDMSNKILLMGGKGDGEGVDGDALAQLLDNPKYAKKDAFEDLLERVQKLEENFGEVSEKQQEHDQTLKTHTKEIEDLKNKKVDSDQFDQEITFIKNHLNSSGDGPPIPTGPSLTSEELNKVKEMLGWYPDASKDLEKLLKEFKDLNLGTLKDHLKDLEDQLKLKADKTELGPIKEEIEALKKLLKDLESELGFLKASNSNAPPQPQTPAIDGDVIVNITNKIEKLEFRCDGLDKKLANLA